MRKHTSLVRGLTDKTQSLSLCEPHYLFAARLLLDARAQILQHTHHSSYIMSTNKLAGLRDFPPPKSWPESGNSARVFAQQMDEWFAEFTTLTGNDLFTTDEKIKKSFFIKDITGIANTHLSLWSQSHPSATYDALKQQFIDNNTDSQQQSRLQEELAKTLKPDLTKPQYRDAIADYIDKFNKAVRELDESGKHNLVLYFKQQLTIALRGSIDAQINVLSDTEKVKVDLNKVQQLALNLSANSQQSWDELRRRYTKRSGVRVHSIATQIQNKNDINMSHSSSNDFGNTQVPVNAVYQERSQKRPRYAASPIQQVLRQYCLRNNLCTWCHNPRHEWINGRCSRPRTRIDDDTLEKFRLSQLYNQPISPIA